MITADLCDQHGREARILSTGLHRFTDVARFSGPACPVVLRGPDGALKALLSTPGAGRVAVVQVDHPDGPAVFGDGMARAAEENGWAGVIILGHLRDVALIRPRSIGILARGTVPFIVRDGAIGRQVERITERGVGIGTSDWIIADEDGVIVLDGQLVT